MSKEKQEELRWFIYWALTIIGLVLIAWHGLGWSARTIDLAWCTESLVTITTGSDKCDPPAKLTYLEQGNHWGCICPK